MEKKYLKPFEWIQKDYYDGFYIDIIGHNKENKTNLWRVKYNPWFYIEIPKEENENEETMGITKLMIYLNEKMYKDSIVGYEVMKKKTIWGYKAEPIKVIKITFNKLVSMYTCRKLLRTKIEGKKYECHEAEVSQITKYQTEKDLLYGEWMEGEGCQIIKKKITTCKEEYRVDSNKLRTVRDQKKIMELGQPIPSIMSIDYEVNATNIKAMPKAHEPDDLIFAACLTFKDKATNRYEKHALVLEECEPIEGVIIHQVKNEKELSDKQGELIMELDPDVLIGHNIFKFDLPYLDARLARGNDIWPQLSRYTGFESKLQTISWESSAYNEVDLGYIACPGRLLLDTLPIIQRSYKLSNYKLETIAQEFLGKGKHDVTPQDIFALYRKHNPKSLAIIVDYCVQDTVLPLELFEVMNLWYNLIEDSNIRRIAIFDLFTRGQDIGVFSQEYYELYHEDYIITQRKGKKLKFEGGFVFDGIPGLYNDILCFDFAGLYPSIMISHNLCYTTMLDNTDVVADEDCFTFDWTDEKTGEHFYFRFVKPHLKLGILPKLLIKLRDNREKDKALLKIEKDATRRIILDTKQNNTKKSMNSVFGSKSSFMSKIPCVPIGMCTCFIGRTSIKKTANYIENKYKSKTIYGDTDSCMEQIPGLHKYYSIIQKIGDKIAEDASVMFIKPMKLEFEKGFSRFFFIGKKMYAGLLMDKSDPSRLNEKNFFCRGIPLARRDNCSFLRVFYKRVLMDIMYHIPLLDILYYSELEIRRLLFKNIPFDDLVIVKKMGKDYKKPSYPMAIYHSYLKSRGELVEPGDRIDYVFVELENSKKALQGDKMQLPKFFYTDDNTLDYRYYLTNIVSNHINKILHIAHPDKIPDSYLLKSMLPFFDSRLTIISSLPSSPLIPSVSCISS